MGEVGKHTFVVFNGMLVVLYPWLEVEDWWFDERPGWPPKEKPAKTRFYEWFPPETVIDMSVPAEDWKPREQLAWMKP